MRVVLGRGLAFGLLLLAVVGAGAQQPPAAPEAPPAKAPAAPSPTREQLKASIQALIGERKDSAQEPDPVPLPVPGVVVIDDAAAERARLQAQLAELLKRINAGPPIGPRPPVGPPKKTDGPPEAVVVDPVRRAMNLFRDGDVAAALGAFRLTESVQLTREDRAFARYMTACCLRRLGKMSDAAVIYREVADVRDDEFLAECAVTQLALMKSAQDLEAQIEQLRARTKSR